VWGPPASQGGGTCRLNLGRGPVVFHGRLMARRTLCGRGPLRQPADLGFGSGEDKRRGGRADGRAVASTVPLTEKVPIYPGCLSAQFFTAAPGRPLCVGALARFSSSCQARGERSPWGDVSSQLLPAHRVQTPKGIICCESFHLFAV